MRVKKGRLVRRRSPDVHWCSMERIAMWVPDVWAHNHANGRSTVVDFLWPPKERKNGQLRYSQGCFVELELRRPGEEPTTVKRKAIHCRLEAHRWIVRMGWPSPWTVKR